MAEDKDVHTSFRWTEEEREKTEYLARHDGMTTSQYIRHVLSKDRKNRAKVLFPKDQAA